MTNHRGPEFHVPDAERCEALVKGQPSWNFKWMQVDHRCPRRGNQMRGPICVCHIHARSKHVTKFEESGK